MTKAELVELLCAERLAVVSTVSSSGAPQAALVGIATTLSPAGELELVFDTDERSRKVANLRANPRVAVVIGGWREREITAQLEGIADEQVDDQLREAYFAAYPDGRERAQRTGIIHVRVRVEWARYSDFATSQISELA